MGCLRTALNNTSFCVGFHPKCAKPINKWFTPALSTLKSARRHLEKIWLNFRSPDHLKLLRVATNNYHSAIIVAKKICNASLVSASNSNPRKLWNSINNLLDCKPASYLPSFASAKSLSQMLATFFSEKIVKLHTAQKSATKNESPHTAPISVFSIPFLKEKYQRSSSIPLTFSVILILFRRLSSNSAYLHSYQPQNSKQTNKLTNHNAHHKSFRLTLVSSPINSSLRLLFHC